MKIHFSPIGHSGSGFTIYDVAEFRNLPSGETYVYDRLHRIVGKIPKMVPYVIEYDNDTEALPPAQQVVQKVQPIHPVNGMGQRVPFYVTPEEARAAFTHAPSEAPTEPMPPVPETVEPKRAPVSHRKPQRKITDPKLVEVLEHATEEIDMRGMMVVDQPPDGWARHFPPGQYASYRVVLPGTVKPLAHLQRPDLTLLQRIGAAMDGVPSKPNAMLSS